MFACYKNVFELICKCNSCSPLSHISSVHTAAAYSYFGVDRGSVESVHPLSYRSHAQYALRRCITVRYNRVSMCDCLHLLDQSTCRISKWHTVFDVGNIFFMDVRSSWLVNTVTKSSLPTSPNNKSSDKERKSTRVVSPIGCLLSSVTWEKKCLISRNLTLCQRPHVQLHKNKFSHLKEIL